MRSLYLPLLAMIMVVSGCEKDAGSSEAREERDPNIISGQQLMSEGKYDEAIAALKQAIESDPTMARPHIDLAVIYQQYKINYIHAIYHYDRYLELRPDAEKAEFIKEQKLKVVQALANTLINNSPEVKKLIDERNKLVQQNNQLKRQLADAMNGSKQTTAPTVASTAPSTTASAQQPKSTTTSKTTTTSNTSSQYQIYHVVAGDTLSKIADKFYGDSSLWDIIFQANRDTLRSPSDLKVGQTIVIPKN